MLFKFSDKYLKMASNLLKLRIITTFSLLKSQNYSDLKGNSKIRIKLREYVKRQRKRAIPQNFEPMLGFCSILLKIL